MWYAVVPLHYQITKTQTIMDLQVGDKIKITNAFLNMTVEIARVTKTKAISKPYNSAGAVYEFKKAYNSPKYIRKYTRDIWSTTEYQLI